MVSFETKETIRRAKEAREMIEFQEAETADARDIRMRCVEQSIKMYGDTFTDPNLIVRTAAELNRWVVNGDHPSNPEESN